MIKSFAGVFLLILVVASLWIPVDLPFTVETTALVYPLESWVLQKNTDGTLVGSLHNFRKRQLMDYSSYQFERGDVVHIRFAREASTLGRVDSGTLIASIISNSLSEELIQLENKLRVERARLQSAEVGEKPEIRIEAEEQILLAKEALVLAEQQLDRAEKMLAEGLVSQQDYENRVNARQQAQIKIQLAEKQLSVVSTGDKPEALQLLKAQIAALEKQINFQQNTSSLYQIYSPIAGKMRFENTPQGDRLIVDNTDVFIFQIPVKLKDRPFIPIGAPVEWKSLHQDTVYEAHLVTWGDKVEIINREQVVMAQAEMRGAGADLLTGMPVRCSIKAGKVTPLEYMKRSLDIKMR